MEKGKTVAPHAIIEEPHKVLRKKAAEVLVRDIAAPHIQHLLAKMQATLASTPDGVGLAAPQINESLRIFIVSEEAEEIDRATKQGWERRRRDDIGTVVKKPYEKREWKHYIFINPVLKNRSRRKLIDIPEGCLSVPGVFGDVARHEKITVEAHNETGRKFTRNCSRFFARVIQHELDHLDGTLFIDKAKGLMKIPEKAEEENEK